MRCVLTAQPLIFSAPHAIYLHRDGAPVHKPEDLTGWIVEQWSETHAAGRIVWAPSEVGLSASSGQPNPANRDPNHLMASELPTNPWNSALRHACRRWPEWACLLCDVHGRRDHIVGVNDPSDCDAGLGAVRSSAPAALAEMLKQHLEVALLRALEGTPFSVNMAPRLSGACAEADRRTVSQQAVACRQPAVQLELSLRLRRALLSDASLRERLGTELVSLAGVLARAASTADGWPAELPPPPPRLSAAPAAAVCAYFSYGFPLELLGEAGTSAAVASLPCSRRTFCACGHPCSWGGAACGLDLSAGASESVNGALCWLTTEQLHQLDSTMGEGEIHRRACVRVRTEGSRWIRALTHVPREDVSVSKRIATVEPSPPYLCLLRRALIQYEDPARGAPLRFPRASGGRACACFRARAACAARAGACQGCVHPVDESLGFGALPLAAFVTEVGVRLQSPWVSLATVHSVCVKLAACHVHTTASLAELLAERAGGKALNVRLQERGLPAFRTQTLAVMRKLLDPTGRG